MLGEDASQNLTDKLESKLFVYEKYLLTFLANCVTASNSSDFVA